MASLNFTVIGTRRLKELERIEAEHAAVMSRLQTAWRWLGEFPDACDVTQWAQGAKGFPADISALRDRMRQRDIGDQLIRIRHDQPTPGQHP